MEANAMFHAKAGLTPKIIRKTDGKCCEWCNQLAGEYKYPSETPHDVFRKHENCGCTVEYDPADGSKKLQDVWSKLWKSRNDSKASQNGKKRRSQHKLSNIEKAPDFLWPRSVGAKWSNHLVKDLETGDEYHFQEGSKMTNVQVYAGKGVRTPYRKAWKYAERYGGRPEDWKHVKGFGIIETEDGPVKVEVHWSECDGYGKHDFFVKRYLS